MKKEKQFDIILKIVLTGVAGLLLCAFIFIVPTFTAMFKDIGLTLPLPTRIIIGLGNFLQKGLPFILVIGGVTYYFRNQIKRRIKEMVDKKRLGMVLGIAGLVIVGVIIIISLCLPMFQMGQMVSEERVMPKKEAEVWADLSARRTAEDMYFAKGETKRRVAKEAAPVAPSLAKRKIIRTANLSLEVKKYDEAYQEIAKIVKELRGFIHHSSKEVAPDGWTRGTVIIRTLPIKFDLVIERIAKLGRVERQEVSGRDVTEEYVDLKARLSNAYKVRARLRAILEERAKKVADILEVEKELERVGEKIERLEGKLRYLRDQVDLSTITIRLHEPKKVVRIELGFLKRLKNAFTAALNVFTQVFTGIIVFLGGLIGILVYGVVIAIIVLVIRKIVRKKKGK